MVDTTKPAEPSAEKQTETPSSPPPPSAPSRTPAPASPPPASPAAGSPPAATPGAGVTEAGILPASHWEALPEEIQDDNDSMYSGVQSSTGSITSTIMQYRTLLGRTYHGSIGKADGWTPNDHQHLESMDLHHHFSTLMLDGKMFLAPLETDKMERVLDVGTGTGIWAVDFADAYPDIKVTGTDITPIQNTLIPPNVYWELDDANESNWTWDSDHFDYVHVRSMLGTIEDWYAFYREAFRVCKPGGWLEHQDEDAVWRADNKEISEKSAMGQWEKVFGEGGKKFGRSFHLIQEDIQRKGMEAAGFVDIVVKDYKCPFGEWPTDPKQREVGMYAKYCLTGDLEGYCNYIWGAVMGWSPIEIQVYLAHLRNEMKDTTLQTWYPHRVVYGRKPE